MIISASTISEINNRLLDLLSTYVHFGTGRQKYALCPLPTHLERTASFSYHKAKRVWKCFGCGAGGDALKLISLMNPGKSFVETVEIACNILDLPVEYENGHGRPVQKYSEPIPEPFESLDLTILKSKICQTKDEPVNDNPLLAGMAEIFGEEIVRTTIERYAITFKGYWVQFPQVDLNGRYRTGKYIKYLQDGHRCKETKPHWAHSGITDNFRQCLTGLHLLNYFPAKHVAIVESPSTMLFMACLSLVAEKYNISQLEFFTNYVWLSTGGISGVNLSAYEVAKDLKGKRVTLYPDSGAFDWWEKYIVPLQTKGVSAAISSLMEKAFKSGKVQKNTDLRDYFTANTEHLKAAICPYPPEWDQPYPLDNWCLQNIAMNLEHHILTGNLEKCDALASEYEEMYSLSTLPNNQYISTLSEFAPNLKSHILSTQ